MWRRIFILFLLFAFLRTNAQNLDVTMLKNINSHRNNSFEGGMEFINNSCYPIAVTVPIAQLIAGYIKKDRALKSDGLETIMGYGYAAVLTTLFKYSLQKDRPYITYTGINVYQTQSDPSFPSGHTAMAFSTATTLVYCYPQWYVAAPAFLWAGTVGYSQMYLGMHYPTDVLVGALVGIGASWLSLKTNEWINDKRERNTLMSF